MSNNAPVYPEILKLKGISSAINLTFSNINSPVYLDIFQYKKKVLLKILVHKNGRDGGHRHSQRPRTLYHPNQIAILSNNNAPVYLGFSRL